MQAVIIDEYGDNSVVQFRNIERPDPRTGELLVKVLAAGVNPVDWKVRDGAGQRMGMTLPIILGQEISGTVERLGEGVTGFEPGDAVYGVVQSGSRSTSLSTRLTSHTSRPHSTSTERRRSRSVG